MYCIDPIYKTKIKEKDLINILSHNYDINSLLEWIFYSNDWINPITNLNFRHDNIEYIIDFIIENNILFDFLNKEAFMKWNIISLSRFKYIYNEYKKYNKKINALDTKLSKKYINESNTIKLINCNNKNIFIILEKIDKVAKKYNICLDNEFEKNYEYIKNISRNKTDLNKFVKYNTYLIKKEKLKEKHNNITNEVNIIKKNIDELKILTYNKIMT